jgi:glycosyltransferase involved in cell wall biosynthesis
MVTREFPPASGGIGYYVYNLSRNLIQRGHEVTVITRGKAGKTINRSVDGINLFEASFFPVYPIHLEIHGFFVSAIVKEIDKLKKISLIHLHSPVVPAIRTKLPILSTIHTAMKVDSTYHEVIDPYSLVEKAQSRFFTPLAELQTLRDSNRVTAVSPSIAKELQNYRVKTGHVDVVWNGVDENKFCPGKTEGSSEYVLYTGVLRARKGLFDLLKSAEIVNSKFPDTKFVICGAGPLLQKLQDQVKGMGLSAQVIFTGRVSREKLIEMYKKATIQVVPSIYEGLPTVVLEAMACGLPVIATNIGGSKDLISSGRNGLLVPVHSPELIAEKIMTLLCDKPNRLRLGRNARNTILENFTWDKITDNFIGLYQTLLD